MDRANDKSLKQIRSKQLSDRAFFFKRLAIGAADQKFSSKLQGLVEEYERAAARITLEAEPASLQAGSARPKGSPALRID